MTTTINSLTIGEQKNDILGTVFDRFLPTAEKRHQIRQQFVAFIRRLTTDRVARKTDAWIEADIISVPNLLSVLRPPLAVVFAIIYQLKPYEFTLAVTSCLTIIILITLTDFGDGYLATRFKQITDIGRRIDPICDKIAAFIIAAVFLQQFETWTLVIFVSLELMLLAGAKYAKQLRRIFPKLVVSANDFGKWKYCVQGLAGLCFLFDFTLMGNMVINVASLLAALSLFFHLYPGKRQLAKLTRETALRP